MRLKIIRNTKRAGLWLSVLFLGVLCAEAIFSQGEGGRVMLDLSGGKVFVTNSTPGLKDPNAVVEKLWVSVSFSDAAQAHGVVVIVTKDSRSVEVRLNLKDRYARGTTNAFNGIPVKGAWQVRIKGESLDGVGIFMTIDCARGTPSGYPTPTPTPRPTPTPTPSPDSGIGFTITPEIQFQALTRILIRKGLITAPELAEEIQRVARER